MNLIFPSFGTEEEGEVEMHWGCWCCLCVSSLLILQPDQVHIGIGVAAFLLLLTGKSDVHLKLSIIPNCMLPVMIVQVLQIVYFYFGVFN